MYAFRSSFKKVLTSTIKEANYLYSLMLLRLIIWSLVIYFFYKFIFEFLMPVGKAASQMKTKINEMQQQMQEQQQQFQQSQQNATVKPPNPTEKSGDYIDFEEVK